MTAQDLKNSILQLAVQGKLVPQDPYDEPASELLKKLNENNKENFTEKINFELPSNWCLTRLRYLISLTSGQDLKPNQYSDISGEIPYITGASNIKNGTVIINRWTNQPRSIARCGDLLISCKGTIGAMAYLNIDMAHIARQIMAVSISPLMCKEYVKLFIQASISELQRAAKSMIPGISRKDLLDLIFPFPPLAEQERIVAKVEELLPLVNEYDEAEKRLSELNVEFPDKLRKSILQQAVQGKLTERDPADEPASELLKRIRAEKAKLIAEGKIKKEKSLPPIADDEKPFDIPDAWMWVRLDDLISIRGGKRMPKGKELITTPTDHIYVRVTDMQNGTILSNDLHYIPDDVFPSISRYIIEKNDVYIVIVGSTIGKTGLVPDAFDGMNLTENAARLTPILLCKEYLYYALSSNMLQIQLFDKTKQVGQPKLAIIRLRSAVIPLPPLAEQKRIVAQVRELLAVCDKLK